MKKFLNIIFLVILFILPVNAEILQGGVSYDVNSARQELLDGISYTIESKYINNYYHDEEYNQNVEYILKGMTELKDRTLAYFSDSTYAVLKKDNPYFVYYYNSRGTLLYIEKKDGLNFPYKAYKYDTSKKLINMSLRVSKGETYIYNSNGKLIAHWLNDKAYDENNNVIMKRKYVE